MKARRPLILLGVSAILGVIAIGAVSRPSQTPTASLDTRKVIVTTIALHVGDEIAAANLKETDFQPASVPTGAFDKIADLTTGLPRVALTAIDANEPVIGSKVSAPGGKASLSSMIDPGMRAVTIRVDDVNGVGGFVTPGDRVDVVLTRGDKPETQQTETLLQSVRVLGVDQQSNEHTDKPTVAKAVTLAVTPEDMQKLKLGEKIGSLGLALRNAAMTDTVATRPFSVADLNPQQPKTAAPVQKVAPAPKCITVIRGSVKTCE